MPMSKNFAERLFSRLPAIVKHFGTPFHIYDERGILQTGDALRRAFSSDFVDLGFREFFAVKANPNLAILRLMVDMGFGFDCSSIPELQLARMLGLPQDKIMFTSNNTSPAEFSAAHENGGCILNLDDITMIDKVPEFPALICFRYNPGERRQGNTIIGNPVEAKYGVRHDQIVEAYRRAKERNTDRFGLHTMVISNQLDYSYMVETIKMLLEVVEMVQEALGIKFDFINMGGGIGIPYRPEQKPFDILALASEAKRLLDDFGVKHGYAPKLFMESGRYMTGPHGVLVTTVLNRMSKHREYVGVDACMSSLMRPAMYDAYHHIAALDKDGKEKTGPVAVVDVVGSLCENNDKFAKQRELPKTSSGDLLVIQDTGAHGYAMCFVYNGRLRPKQLLLKPDDSVELIGRAETFDDYIKPMTDFSPDVLRV